MALKPTIYKVELQLADSDRHCYENLPLTLALHPSETTQRLLARLIAYGLCYQPGLEFTKGLSTAEEPDIWCHTDDGRISLWIEMGQPDDGRLRKAQSRAERVEVYAFGKSVDTWWGLNESALSKLNARIWQLSHPVTSELADHFERTSVLSLSVSGGEVYLDLNGHSAQFTPGLLHGEI